MRFDIQKYYKKNLDMKEPYFRSQRIIVHDIVEQLYKEKLNDNYEIVANLYILFNFINLNISDLEKDFNKEVSDSVKLLLSKNKKSNIIFFKELKNNEIAYKIETIRINQLLYFYKQVYTPKDYIKKIMNDFSYLINFNETSGELLKEMFEDYFKYENK